jgi:SNF2 family DNA or RNA helicase
MLTRHAPEVVKKLQLDLNAELDEESAQFIARLEKVPPVDLPPVDEGLSAILRPYQQSGVLFLLDRSSCGAGAILADDMGLGKTVSTLTAISQLMEAYQRGEKVMKVYKQMKMYNDPALNPVLYGQK